MSKAHSWRYLFCRKQMYTCNNGGALTQSVLFLFSICVVIISTSKTTASSIVHAADSCDVAAPVMGVRVHQQSRRTAAGHTDRAVAQISRQTAGHDCHLSQVHKKGYSDKKNQITHRSINLWGECVDKKWPTQLTTNEMIKYIKN